MTIVERLEYVAAHGYQFEICREAADHIHELENKIDEALFLRGRLRAMIALYDARDDAAIVEMLKGILGRSFVIDPEHQQAITDADHDTQLDTISEAIQDSMGPDWNSRLAAQVILDRLHQDGMFIYSGIR